MEWLRIFRNRRGFTLLELLISFVLIGLIMVIVLGAMRLGVKAVESGEKRIESLERLRTSMLIVSSQIQSQAPLTFEEDANKKSYFQGDRESLQFASNFSIWSGQTGFVVVHYKIVPDGDDKKMLTASEQIIGMAQIRETVLLKALDSITFEYFSKGPTDEKGQWNEQWTETQDHSSPEKIRLNLSFRKKNFSMIIPMRANTIPAPPQGSQPQQ